MANEKFQRQDVLNGLALTGVLALLLVFVLLGAWSCTASLGSVSQGVERVPETTTTLVEEVAPDTTLEPEPAKAPADVVVRVGNGANISGLATAGTRLLSQNGYSLLQGQTKQGDTVETSTVYYGEGFEANAFLVAELLAIPSQQVEPIEDDLGVDIDNADIVVILGEDADF